jgi:putative membrane protein
MQFTYFGVLLRFVVPPLVVLAGLTALDLRRGRRLPSAFHTWSPWTVLGAHVLAALIYTTPWDNYLVASGVWWYNPALVTGLRLGHVPIEEYTFFVLQTLLAGLWVLWWMRRLPVEVEPLTARRGLRRWTAAALGVLWAIWLALFAVGWMPGRYMALILVWALPPLVLQVAFGADILWRYRRLVLAGLLPVLAYLSLVDAIAIGGGTWTISADDTLGVKLGGVLPLEEFVFFVVTNTLIVFGMVLVLARESHERSPIGRRA